jgi:hypothetical protein
MKTYTTKNCEKGYKGNKKDVEASRTDFFRKVTF